VAIGSPFIRATKRTNYALMPIGMFIVEKYGLTRNYRGKKYEALCSLLLAPPPIFS